MATLIRFKSEPYNVNLGATIEHHVNVAKASGATSGNAIVAYVHATLVGHVGAELIYSRQTGGGSQPRDGGMAPMGNVTLTWPKLPAYDDRTQHEQFIAQVRAIVLGGNKKKGREPEPQTTPEPEPHTMPEPTPEPQPEPRTPEPGCVFGEYEKRLEFLRRFATDRKLSSLDSMRAALDGEELLAAGLPLDGVVSNVCAEWGPDSRMQAGVTDFDWAAWGISTGTVGDFEHATAPAVVACVKANVPAYLYGGAGTGKSSGAKKAAELLGLPYFEVNLSGATPAALTGRDRLKEFVESEYVTAYRDGGIIVLEEVDNAHPQVLTVLNNSIAGDEFHNPVNGEVVKRHPDFRIVATANTLGTGAKDGFVRNKLDGATLDRFRLGRIHVGHDARLERNILRARRADMKARRAAALAA